MQALTNIVVRVGVDIVDIARMKRFIAENSSELATVFTAGELAYCMPKRRKSEHLAARFAAKEAVLKAFGTGMGQGMLWTDVEVVQKVTGRPRVSLHGRVADCAHQRGLLDIDVSLSHTESMAIAQAIAIWSRENSEASTCLVD